MYFDQAAAEAAAFGFLRQPNRPIIHAAVRCGSRITNSVFSYDHSRLSKRHSSPALGVTQTSKSDLVMCAYDPKQTSAFGLTS
jgi:hypothetical protein